VRAQLAAQGFTEVYNYSFVNEAETKTFLGRIDDHIAVKNPIASELTHLRRSLLPGVFQNIVSNVRHYSQFRFFEIGAEIHPGPGSELPEERTHVVAALYEAHADEQDFFELKRVAECLFADSRLSVTEARSYEHPARTAQMEWRGSVIGRLFELHPSLLEQEGIEGRAMLFDVDLELARHLSVGREYKYVPLRKYPSSGFDLSVVAALKLPVADIQDRLVALAGSTLVSIDFIRQYAGPPLPPGQKSVSYHLEVGALSHTMSTDEVTEIRNGIIRGMQSAGFELRGL
jgi:phenylalanyl-tRNA synthetase beta chain